ncbi:MAG: PhzF family phenazine biosynthesis isomerase [Caldithrix sp.]|nr:PhzF family phenazine biosynthesis isomerase [Caldithrix sp.]
MQLPLYQVDVFTDRLFRGNPAAVCPLPHWLEDDLLQSIAAENNLSETAFFVKEKEDYRLRWFTPRVEVELCGHATMASAFVIFRNLESQARKVHFNTLSGRLSVRNTEQGLQMDLPAYTVEPCAISQTLIDGLQAAPKECYRSKHYLAVFENEQDIIDMQPDFAAIKALDVGEVMVSAPGREVDFVSRFFAPAVGIDEDPVTGAAHSTLTPYWAKRLQKHTMQARQLSGRGGRLLCTLRNDRVLLTGQAVLYLKGNIVL